MNWPPLPLLPRTKGVAAETADGVAAMINLQYPVQVMKKGVSITLPYDLRHL